MSMRLRFCMGAVLACVAFAITAAAVPPPLTADEQRIVAAVKTRSADALQLLERTVNVNSGTLNVEGVRAVGRLFRRELDDLGFETRWVELPPEMRRAGHLIGIHTPKGKARGKRLLLLGHLDTVFEKDQSSQPWTVKGPRIAGPGVNDMKGGNVVLVEALRALKAVGALDDMQVAVMFTGDEERVGHPVERSRAEMLALARQSDVALSFESMLREVDGSELVATARRASSSWTVTVTARQGHSSGVFGPVAGYGAAYEMARILNVFREQLIEPDLTFNPGLVMAGTEVEYDESQARGSVAGKNNIIAPTASVRGDLRYLTAEQRERVHRRMKEIVADSLRGTTATIAFRESYPPMAPTPGNAALHALYSALSEAAGYGAVGASAPGVRGAGDVQFVAPLLDCLDGLGAAGGGAHGPNEFLYPDSIERNAVRAALLMARLAR